MAAGHSVFASLPSLPKHAMAYTHVVGKRFFEMRPEEFKNIWTSTGDTLSPLTESRLIGLDLKPKTIEFLTKSGLPVATIKTKVTTGIRMVKCILMELKCMD